MPLLSKENTEDSPKLRLLANLASWANILEAKKASIDREIAALHMLASQVDSVGEVLITEMAKAIRSRHPELAEKSSEPVDTPATGGRRLGHGPMRQTRIHTVAVSPRTDADSEDDDEEVFAKAVQELPLDTTQRAKIIHYFVINGNKPATNLEIREALGISRGAVAVILYHKDSIFEKLPKNEANKTPWRLKPETYRSLAAQRPNNYGAKERGF